MIRNLAPGMDPNAQKFIESLNWTKTDEQRLKVIRAEINEATELATELAQEIDELQALIAQKDKEFQKQRIAALKEADKLLKKDISLAQRRRLMRLDRYLTNLAGHAGVAFVVYEEDGGIIEQALHTARDLGVTKTTLEHLRRRHGKVLHYISVLTARVDGMLDTQPPARPVPAVELAHARAEAEARVADKMDQIARLEALAQEQREIIQQKAAQAAELLREVDNALMTHQRLLLDAALLLHQAEHEKTLFLVDLPGYTGAIIPPPRNGRPDAVFVDRLRRRNAFRSISLGRAGFSTELRRKLAVWT